MTITEAYERLEAIFPPEASITVQCDTWKHHFAGERRAIETGFVVSGSDAPIFNGATLEEAVIKAEKYFAGEQMQATPADVDTFFEEAVTAGTAER